MSLTSFARRDLLEPLWAAARGSPRLRAWKAAEASQYLSDAELRARQWERLKALLAFVYAHNGFHRQRFDEHGLTPDAIRDFSDFTRLPILTKPEVRAGASALFSEGVVESALMHAKTGGSTGRALDLYFTEEVSETRNGCARRHLRWSGWEVGEPTARIWGNPQYPTTLRDKAREWLLDPCIYLDTMSVSPDSVRQFAREWAGMQPTLIFGHAHSVYTLADLVRTEGISGITPKAVVTSSMMLVEHERRVIEQVFGLRVLDLYGCEEVGLIASECERHEGMHMNLDQVVVEVLQEDGTPAAPGEAGDIVVTDLLNRAMPLIRYRMEDKAEVATQPCPCGRGLPVFRRVVGRVADFLRRADGSRVAGISLIENSLTRIPGIDQMQIVQDTLTHLELRIVPGRDFDAARREELATYFARTFPGATIDIEDVSRILPEPNGKYRFSICRVTDAP